MSTVDDRKQGKNMGYLPVHSGVCSKHDGHTALHAEFPEQMHQLRGIL
jgi:hypothetical protein